MADIHRVTQVGLEVVEGGEKVLRVTQVGLEVVEGGASPLRVTQVGLELVVPDLNTIAVNPLDTTATGLLTSDVSFVVQTRWQLAEASDPTFTAPLVDVIETPGLGYLFTGLTPSTSYYARAITADAIGWTIWSRARLFTTMATAHPIAGGSLFSSPLYGEPISGTHTIKWKYPNTLTTAADLYVSSNLGSAWVLLASGVVGKQYDLDTTLFADGIDFLLRLVFNDPVGTEAVHYGFKVENTTGVTTTPTTWIPYTGALGVGPAGHRLLYDDACPWWWQQPFDGYAAQVGGIFSTPAAVAVPPQAPYADDVDITSYARAGTLNGWNGWATVNWAQRYLQVEGSWTGVVVGAQGTITGGDMRGICAGIFFGQIMPGQADTTDGLCSNFTQFEVYSIDTPTGVWGGGAYNASYNLFGKIFAFGDRSGAPDYGKIPVRLRVTRTSPTMVDLKAGICGYAGTPYWLVEATDVPFAVPDPTAACEGNCGWLQVKGFSSVWGGAFREGAYMGVTRLSAPAPADCGCAPYRACPPLTNLIALFGRKAVT